MLSIISTTGFIKKLDQYSDEIADKLEKMTKKAAVQTKYRTLKCKNPVSIVDFHQNCTSVSDVLNIHYDVAMWTDKHYLNGQVDSVIN